LYAPTFEDEERYQQQTSLKLRAFSKSSCQELYQTDSAPRRAEWNQKQTAEIVRGQPLEKTKIEVKKKTNNTLPTRTLYEEQQNKTPKQSKNTQRITTIHQPTVCSQTGNKYLPLPTSSSKEPLQSCHALGADISNTFPKAVL